MEATNQLKLYSISAAAKVLALGKDTLYRLVADGKVGFIEIGKRKKIPFNELVRFQHDNIKRKSEVHPSSLITKDEVIKFFNINHTQKKSLSGHEILQSIMR
jgi:excisionase family DNA binding protein